MEQRSQLYQEIKTRNDQLAAYFSNQVRAMVADEPFINLTTKQLMLLDLLAKQPLTVNDIAHAFQMTASAASQLVKKLESGQYVKREINTANRREILVQLDKEGEAYSRKMEEIELSLLEKYYGRLEETELLQLKNILDKLCAAAMLEQNE